MSRPLLRIVNKTGPGRRFPRVVPTGLLAIMVLFSAAPSDAQPAVRQVLMLQSFDRGTFPVDQFTSDFRIELDQRATEPVNVVQIVVGPTGSVGAPDQVIVDYIRSSFLDRPKPDLVVTVAGPAAVFARRYRQQLFPDTPILFASVDRRFLDDAPLGDNETAVAVDNQFSRTIETILQLLPETRQVFMVMGSGPLGRFWRRELESQFGRFRDRLTFVWSNDLSLQEILRRCTSLPEHSAILYISFGADAAGASFPDERLFAELRDTANAPLFAGQSVYLGHGIVGGSLLSIDDMSRDTADVAVRLLQGAAPKSINVPVRLPRATDVRLARAPTVGHPREPATARESRALSRSEPVERLQEHRTERHGRAGHSIAPDHRTALSAPRTTTGRTREPEPPGARRRRQSSSDDVGVDEFYCP